MACELEGLSRVEANEIYFPAREMTVLYVPSWGNENRTRWIEYYLATKSTKQILIQLGGLLFGLRHHYSAIVIFSERITRVTAALHRRTSGIELPRGWSRGGAVIVGVLSERR